MLRRFLLWLDLFPPARRPLRACVVYSRSLILGMRRTEIRKQFDEIVSFADWVKLDLEYIDNWSLWLDLKILLLTIPAVLFWRGAK